MRPPIIYATDTYQRAFRQGPQGKIRPRRLQREQYGSLLQAIVEACEEEKAPFMLQISKGARQYANPVYLKKLIEAAVSTSNIPMAVHLDHGDTFELCKDCVDEGFTSVMIDGSHEPFAKNVELCRRVVEYAHPHNCVVEGELGMLVGAQHDAGEEGAATPRAAPTPTRAKPWNRASDRGGFPGRRHRQLPRRL